MRKRGSFFKWILLLPFMWGICSAHEILVNTKDGETFIFNADPEESLNDLQETIVALSNGKKSNLWIELSTDGQLADLGSYFVASTHGAYLGYPRNYQAEVTPEEKSDIRLIVTTLADTNIFELPWVKGELEAAGDRIDRLHPLRFLMTVFTDEELKVGIRIIHGRGLIWGRFVGGLKDCLETEMQIGNMTDAQICHFAVMLKIDPNQIMPVIAQKNWEAFVVWLIKNIPRSGDYDRYDT